MFDRYIHIHVFSLSDIYTCGLLEHEHFPWGKMFRILSKQLLVHILMILAKQVLLQLIYLLSCLVNFHRKSFGDSKGTHGN